MKDPPIILDIYNDRYRGFWLDITCVLHMNIKLIKITVKVILVCRLFVILKGHLFR